MTRPARHVPFPPVTCPRCHTPFRLDDALRLELEGVLFAEMVDRHQQQLARHSDELDLRVRTLAAEQAAAERSAAAEDAAEQRVLSAGLRGQVIDLTRQVGHLQTEREQANVDFEAQLADAQGQARRDERRRLVDAHRVKEREWAEQKQQLQADADRLQQRIDQGHPNGRGGALQRELAEVLHDLWPDDDVTQVRRFQHGADVVQQVLTPGGTSCGTVLWEAKNARQWQHGWIPKLKKDMRDAGADHAVVVAASTPDGIGMMANIDGLVWAARPGAVPALAAVLRQSLVHTHSATELAINNGERAVALHRYFSGPEFRQRLEMLREFIAEQEDEIGVERRFFTQRWARMDKRIRAVAEAIAGFCGDIEGLGGARLEALPTFALDEGGAL